MAGKVKPVPEGYHRVTPHLVVKNAAEAIPFYEKAFGAKELNRASGPGGGIMHAEMQFGDSRVMLNDEFPDMGAFSPESLKGTPVVLHLFVEDVDAAFDRAIKAGCEPLMPLSNMFWGDRYGQVRDPFGHRWSLATRIENLTPEESMRRAEKFFASAPGCS